MANLALKNARLARKLTLDALSELVGISASQLSRFESGKRDPRQTELARLAAVLGVPPMSLFEDRPDPAKLGRGDAEPKPAPPYSRKPAPALEIVAEAFGFDPERLRLGLSAIDAIDQLSADPEFRAYDDEEHLRLARILARNIAKTAN